MITLSPAPRALRVLRRLRHIRWVLRKGEMSIVGDPNGRAISEAY